MILADYAYFKPVTVLQVIQKSSEFLTRKGVDSPRLQVELLLSHFLKLPRMALYLNFERVLNPAELDGMRELIRRRGEREPLQHITGSTSFCGYEMLVNRHVLVPRPETELLAEAGWTFLNKLVTSSNGGGTTPLNAPTALDFGTGTGCIAIAIAAKCPSATVDCLDASPDALEMAKQNIAAHKLESRIRLMQGNGFSAIPEQQTYDLIISNPPYIATAEISTLDAEVRDFDPAMALNGGEDGLDFYRQLATEAARFLKPQGKLMLEFGCGQDKCVEEILSQQKWIVADIRADYNRIPRYIIARRH